MDVELLALVLAGFGVAVAEFVVVLVEFGAVVAVFEAVVAVFEAVVVEFGLVLKLLVEHKKGHDYQGSISVVWFVVGICQ